MVTMATGTLTYRIDVQFCLAVKNTVIIGTILILRPIHIERSFFEICLSFLDHFLLPFDLKYRFLLRFRLL